MLDTSGWRGFRIGNLFDSIAKAESYSKDALDVCDVFNNSAIPHVTRTDENNAVDAFVVNSGFSGLERGNAIVIGDTTSTISYQPDDFIAGDHIVVMRAGWLNVLTGLFLVSLLQKERFRYSYGRAFIMPLIAGTVVKLPVTSDGKVDWAWIEKFMSQYYQGPLQSQNRPPVQPLAVDKWQEFRIGSLFKLQRGKCHDSDSLDDGNDLFYVGAKKDDNGIMRRVAYQPGMVFPGNCMIFICNGAGSVGYALYQDCDFIPSGDLVIGYNKNLNPYIGLFLVPILDRERDKYSFGRKWGKYVADTVIKLPATTDAKGCIVPDWAWMEQYMKSLPYSDLI